ncbi:hypothetical protein BDF21DRAFT_348659 [Thamnidium elegans]|nr:hypothetical protein BDF21DRAFT_348659 [Thamnidium elegans]
MGLICCLYSRVSDAIEELTKNRNLSIKTITRHPVARNQNVKIKERREWVETRSKTDMN